MLLRVADLCYRARRRVLLLWLVALVASVAAASAWGGEYKQDYLQAGSDSKAASDTLLESFPARSGAVIQVVLRADGGLVGDVRVRAERLLGDLADRAHVVEVVSPFRPGAEAQQSADGRTAYAEINLDQEDNEFTAAQAAALVDPLLAAGGDGLQVEVGGPVAKLAQAAPVGSEAIGLLAAALILLVVFGSAVAMGLPLIVALFGLGIALTLGELLRHVVDVPDWAPSTAAMVGLGVGIDYALFIVTRFRSSLAAGLDPRRATLTAVTTAGRAVLFAGSTVVVSMLGILLIGQPALTGFAVTVVVAVLVVMLGSVTLLPAALGFAGASIERLHVPFVSKTPRVDDSSRWYRWSRFIQRRPWTAVLASLAVLLALAAPLVGIRFGFPGAGNDRNGSTTRAAYDLVAEAFGPGAATPVLLTVQGATGDELDAAAGSLAADLEEVSGVAHVAPPLMNSARDTALIQLSPTTTAQDEATDQLVDRLRDTSIPAASAGTGLTVHVGGLVAGNLDTTRGVTDRLPWFFGSVLALSFILLTVVFRSVVVPLKAVLMNVLSSAAAFGVLVVAVNGGPLGELLGIPEAIPIPILLPVGIFAILFGLSMDYEVFLLSRIKEEYDRTHDNAVSVADGLAKSARVITAGAAVMVTVFLAFVLADDVLGKMFGIGLAAAVLIDATLVRMVLVPASMELLGDRNWWLPRWLDRALPDIHVEGHDDADDVVDLRDRLVAQRTAPAPDDLRV